MCARGLETRLSKLGDAKAAKVDLDKEQAIVTFPPDTKVTDKDIEKTVTDAGFNVVKIEWRTNGGNGDGSSAATAEFQIEGMHCERCAANLAKVLQQHPGVRSADVAFESKIARVTYEAGSTDTDAIAKTIESLGVFKAKPVKVDPVAGSNDRSRTPQTGSGVRK
ncbi:MAG: heavy-metal-associated domain-containing protein [Acidobacteria bacterium]|nr:heavy-metal-associated domain-containing protein [Acidobacteriota bacterium]